jgi:predicted Ser/Thr protein kinase
MSEISNTIRIGIYSVDFNQILGKGATGYVYRG